MWIKEDFPPEIEQRRQIITPYLRAAYQGNPANPHGKISAYLKYDKLILNNQLTCALTYTHVYSHTHTRTHMYSCALMCTHLYSFALTHLGLACTLTYTHVYSHAHTRTQMYSCALSCTHLHSLTLDSHVHSHAHTRTHMYSCALTLTIKRTPNIILTVSACER